MSMSGNKLHLRSFPSLVRMHNSSNISLFEPMLRKAARKNNSANSFIIVVSQWFPITDNLSASALERKPSRNLGDSFVRTVFTRTV